MSREALERIRELAESGRLHTWDIRPANDGHMSAVETDVSPDVLALLAEVARLEQERDDLEGELADFGESRPGRLARAEAALAVAREREQRAVEALREIADRHPDAKTGEHPAVDIARAALATLAEPEGATESQQATSLGGLGAADTRGAKPSGSASAAADEPMCCPRCGNETTEADLTYSGCGVCRAEAAAADLVDAAADKPGETP